ncbi:type II toxin-antitoxin system RelB/DinJ family antitoxin [Rhodopseudomonas sp. HC1]|uniref:type II toxin-antitoxin system RelB/DinJ family antitoxin n=1 Tax=Rhodopseudomonas infernalis TaxID=2897386 RepID=UPI001EE82B75|nr:type II toxin-antitoxin system RelB/DinJ family antitoxin [Rhodopseudomonas infernalis]MCG6207351.1 type II toxin-antitoxin system RelB/DinJ family antitoxin [Rhodopseudomonas infernalis]
MLQLPMPARSRTKSTTGPATKQTARPPAATAARKAVKSGYINARVEPKLKKSAEAVLDKLGLSTTDAVTIFLKQVVAHKGLPFPVKLPNKETIRALRDAERGRVTRFSGTTEEFFAHLDKKTR